MAPPVPPTPGAPGPHTIAPAFAQMHGSVPRTMRVNATSNKNPTTLYLAADVPLRIVLRNVGAAVVFLATEFAEAIASSGLPGSGTMILPVGAERVVVLAPRQALYATCLIVGRVTLFASDALPII